MAKVRFAVGCAVYAMLWWPIVIVTLPFWVIGMAMSRLVHWLDWDAIPAISRTTVPAYIGVHNVIDALGSRIAGRQALATREGETP